MKKDPVENPVKDPNYSDFVAALAKPGEDILTSLTPEKCHLWHMAGEVRGEFLELMMASAANDRDNILEEAGDMLFYLQGALQAILPKDSTLPREFETRTINRTWYDSISFTAFMRASPRSSLLSEVEAYGTLAKRFLIYERYLEQIKLIEATFRIVIHLRDSILPAHGWTLRDAFEANRRKLNDRYHEGTYSNQQAQVRADK